MPTLSQIKDCVSQHITTTLRDHPILFGTVLIAHLLHLAFLVFGATPWEGPEEWVGAHSVNVNSTCVWDSKTVDYIRCGAWATVPLWMLASLVPMVLCATTLDNDLYSLWAIINITTTMITAFTTTVPALLFTVAVCEVEDFRVTFCWVALACQVVGVVASSFL